MKKPHDDWLYLAHQDLLFAKAGLREGFFSHVCFLAHQAVEKAMKGYLISRNKDYPRTHGLVTLHRLMSVKWLDDHIVAIKKLSEFYVPLRYPDAFPGVLPEGLPDEDDARNALNWAESIVGEVQKHLKS